MQQQTNWPLILATVVYHLTSNKTLKNLEGELVTEPLIKIGRGEDGVMAVEIDPEALEDLAKNPKMIQGQPTPTGGIQLVFSPQKEQPRIIVPDAVGAKINTAVRDALKRVK